MAVSNLARTFGSKANSTPAAAKDDRPKAQFWMNIGYVSNVKDEDGTMRFVSLGQGVAVDTIEDLPTNSRNRDYAFFNQARNELRDEVLAEAKALKPGESIYIGDSSEGNLCIQLRRVGEEVAAPTGENPFARRKAE